jgi:glycosyltransferase involved in cell wall biosynthesis
MAQARPRVSIITPTFNRADFIRSAVESVLAQTFGDFELLIVDDGSTDNTVSVLEPYLSDVRIRYFHQPNQGQSVARNRGLAEAQGELICFLDSDDAWLENKLEKQVSMMDQYPEVDIIHGDEIDIDEYGREISRKNMRRFSGMIARQLLADNSVSINTVMVRSRCFDEMGGFSEERRVADDYEIWLRFASRYRFLYVPAFFGFYRVMSNQISSDKRARFESNERIVLDFVRDFPEALSRSDRHWGLSRFYCRKARYYARAGDKIVACGAIVRALRYCPADPVVWRSLFRVIRPSGI